MTRSETERMQSWLSRGASLEHVLVAQALEDQHKSDTRAALRELICAWVRTRDLVTANIVAAGLVRALSAWASDAVLMDVVHWALGPDRWTGP